MGTTFCNQGGNAENSDYVFNNPTIPNRTSSLTKLKEKELNQMLFVHNLADKLSKFEDMIITKEKIIETVFDTDIKDDIGRDNLEYYTNLMGKKNKREVDQSRNELMSMKLNTSNQYLNETMKSVEDIKLLKKAKANGKSSPKSPKKNKHISFDENAIVTNTLNKSNQVRYSTQSYKPIPNINLPTNFYIANIAKKRKKKNKSFEMAKEWTLVDIDDPGYWSNPSTAKEFKIAEFSKNKNIIKFMEKNSKFKRIDSIPIRRRKEFDELYVNTNFETSKYVQKDTSLGKIEQILSLQDKLNKGINTNIVYHGPYHKTTIDESNYTVSNLYGNEPKSRQPTITKKEAELNKKNVVDKYGKSFRNEEEASRIVPPKKQLTKQQGHTGKKGSIKDLEMSGYSNANANANTNTNVAKGKSKKSAVLDSSKSLNDLQVNENFTASLKAEFLKLNEIVLRKPNYSSYITINLVFNNDNETKLTKDIIRDLRSDDIIYDGNFLKIHDAKHGCKIVDRYFQITKDSVKYFKSMYSASVWNSKPLKMIRIEDIKNFDIFNDENFNEKHKDVEINFAIKMKEYCFYGRK